MLSVVQARSGKGMDSYPVPVEDPDAISEAASLHSKKRQLWTN